MLFPVTSRFTLIPGKNMITFPLISRFIWRWTSNASPRGLCNVPLGWRVLWPSLPFPDSVEGGRLMPHLESWNGSTGWRMLPKTVMTWTWHDFAYMIHGETTSCRLIDWTLANRQKQTNQMTCVWDNEWEIFCKIFLAALCRENPSSSNNLEINKNLDSCSL